MGHQLLGHISRTRKWREVVGLIGCGASVSQVATAALQAAARVLKSAVNDSGVIDAIWMLMQLPSAAKAKDFAGALRDCGLAVAGPPTLFDLTSAFSAALENSGRPRHLQTDLGIAAHQAAAQSLQETMESKSRSLFETGSGEVQRALARMGGSERFRHLGRSFFGNFMFRCLNSILGRTLSDHIGEGKRFQTVRQRVEFERDLERHCRESSAVVEKYSGQWYQKHDRRTGHNITREDVSGFAGYAVEKLISVLYQGDRRA